MESCAKVKVLEQLEVRNLVEPDVHVVEHRLWAINHLNQVRMSSPVGAHIFAQATS
jgi:hypothetical protein